ncbi:MAG: nuclear transport factor 2 family protein [Betaproteobacteria bacterium]|nr:nuclear transport factor 2 family protein [Betaproteobacteria bacterium]
MHPHEQLVRNFYAAFARRDAAAMAACYHPDMITLVSASADAEGGKAHWDAVYTFSQTGRKVHNKIDALFAFRDGKIVRHIDRFSFWRWSSQALGPLGLLLGWSWPIKAMVRKKARASLDQWMERKATS